MKNTNILIGSVVVVALAFYFVFFANKQPPSVSTTTQSQIATSQNVPISQKIYSINEVALHKDTSSCWSVINNKVYNLTSWINQHPGGPDFILSICGIDGSSTFNQQHGGQRKPENELSSFYIGDLKS